MYSVHTSTGFLYWYVPCMYITKFICESTNQYVPAAVTTVFRGMMNSPSDQMLQDTFHQYIRLDDQSISVSPVSIHLDHPWHPYIECQTFDIERNLRYRRLRYRMHVRYRRFLHSISYIDIEDSKVFDIE